MSLYRTLRRVKRAVWNIAGLDFVPSADTQRATVSLGSDYGGWTVLPDLLDADSVVYSVGVGDDVSFDVAMIERFGMTVHAFDPTPKAMAFVQQAGLPAAFTFHPVGLADIDGALTFAAPTDPNHVSYSSVASESAAAIEAPVKRLSTLMAELQHDHIDLLKMDIEGSEYAVVADILAGDIRPRQLLVEIHHRFESISVADSRGMLADLRAAGYGLFHVSDPGIEWSLVDTRADRAGGDA